MFIVYLAPLLAAIAFFTLLERKAISSIQLREGPITVGFLGFLQPIADGVKLLTKEIILPRRSGLVVFLIAPFLSFGVSLVTWSVVPFSNGFGYNDLPLGLLFILAVSSLGVYSLLMSGWASNSKYGFLGSIRSTAQMVSYEVSITFLCLAVALCSGTFNLTGIVNAQTGVWYTLPLLTIAIPFYISALAETNRTPFDLPEAEAELVAGFNVEYSGFIFAMFFLAEYANILLICSLFVILFLGGWLLPINFLAGSWVPSGSWLVMKLLFIAFSFVWIRATTPRFRYDQLMRLGWKKLLPWTLASVFTISILLFKYQCILSTFIHYGLY